MSHLIKTRASTLHTKVFASDSSESVEDSEKKDLKETSVVYRNRSKTLPHNLYTSPPVSLGSTPDEELAETVLSDNYDVIKKRYLSSLNVRGAPGQNLAAEKSQQDIQEKKKSFYHQKEVSLTSPLSHSTEGDTIEEEEESCEEQKNDPQPSILHSPTPVRLLPVPVPVPVPVPGTSSKHRILEPDSDDSDSNPACLPIQKSHPIPIIKSPAQTTKQRMIFSMERDRSESPGFFSDSVSSGGDSTSDQEYFSRNKKASTESDDNFVPPHLLAIKKNDQDINFSVPKPPIQYKF